MARLDDCPALPWCYQFVTKKDCKPNGNTTTSQICYYVTDCDLFFDQWTFD